MNSVKSDTNAVRKDSASKLKEDLFNSHVRKGSGSKKRVYTSLVDEAKRAFKTKSVKLFSRAVCVSKGDFLDINFLHTNSGAGKGVRYFLNEFSAGNASSYGVFDALCSIELNFNTKEGKAVLGKIFSKINDRELLHVYDKIRSLGNLRAGMYFYAEQEKSNFSSVAQSKMGEMAQLMDTLEESMRVECGKRGFVMYEVKTFRAHHISSIEDDNRMVLINLLGHLEEIASEKGEVKHYNPKTQRPPTNSPTARSTPSSFARDLSDEMHVFTKAVLGIDVPGVHQKKKPSLNDHDAGHSPRKLARNLLKGLETRDFDPESLMTSVHKLALSSKESGEIKKELSEKLTKSSTEDLLKVYNNLIGDESINLRSLLMILQKSWAKVDTEAANSNITHDLEMISGVVNYVELYCYKLLLLREVPIPEKNRVYDRVETFQDIDRCNIDAVRSFAAWRPAYNKLLNKHAAYEDRS